MSERSGSTIRVFARNAAGKLMMGESDPVTGAVTWTQLGDRPIVEGPASLWSHPVVRTPDGAVEAYFRSPDNHVRLIDTFLSCSQVTGCVRTTIDGDLGGAVASAPGVVRLDGSRVDVFARGTNGRLQHTWRYGTTGDPWAAWEDLGGITFVESPSAVSWQNGNRLDVFVKGGDTHLWHKWWTSAQGWTGWENLGGVLTSAPSVIRFDDTRLDVFAKSTSDTLIHRVWQAGTGWSGWEDLGGRFQYSPAAVKTADRRIDIAVTGSTAQLETIRWS